ncbi:PEGA domain-containing protein [uncultured Methanoregula sp.]|uniref:PEGA domain-containing protein n=1 Tax=uncultured Methanoregula sp. TaxID=1005933 RepID=UPI002AAB1DBF|nr:PEGA domain-containing protein [uncultured Methanoregula sp.]
MTNKYLILLLALAIIAAVMPVVAADDNPGDIPIVIPTTTKTPTPEPTTPPYTPVTAPPTEEPTVTVPTVVTLPTTEPTVTVPTMVTQPTTHPTGFSTTVPTETWTIEPTQAGGGKGWITTFCNVDGATVSFNGVTQGTIAGGSLTVPVSPSGTPVSTITVTKYGYTTWQGAPSHMPEDQETVSVYATINPISTPTTAPPAQYGTIYAQSTPSGAQIYMNGNFCGYAPVTIPNLLPNTYSMRATLNGYTSDSRTVTVYAGQTTYYSPVLQQSPQPSRSTGTVYVTSNPDHAMIYVDGNYQGKAPLTVTLYPGSHTFRLTLTGYNDYTTTVYVNGGTAQNLNAVMTSASYGSVTITSLPGATVYMDSNTMGKIPSSGVLTLNNILNGNHLFKITAPGYNDWMNTIYVRGNTVTPFTATLTPIGTNPTPVPATGAFNIVSTPAGSEVYIDNLFKGYTPGVFDGISPGQHQILLKYTGYMDYPTTSTVNSGQTTPLAISLQPAPTPTPQSAPSPVILIGGLAGMVALGAALRRRS